MSVAERLRAARGTLGLKQDEMSARTGIPIETYKKYEGSTRQPGAEALAGLVRAGVNVNWLLTGEGPMLLSGLSDLPEVAAKLQEELDAARRREKALQERVEQLAAELTAARANAQGINAPAMRAIIVGTIEGQKAYSAPAEHIARLAVDFYLKAIAEGMITPTGIGEEEHRAA